MMKLIVAADRRGGIGKEGKLLVHLPGDIKYFKETTSGHTVIMGRKTFQSLPSSRPLPDRRNIIISKLMIMTKILSIKFSLNHSTIISLKI